MKTAYDFIVVGCGGIGSAAAYRLAREAGGEVLVLEQFQLGHDNGASQDHSRIIRLTYDDPAYTALTPYAFAAWADVEAESGVPLVHRTGSLHLADAGTASIANYAKATRGAGISIEELTAPEVMRRWPQWHLDEGQHGFHQADGGLVDAAKANAVHARLARAHGATILEQTRVRHVRPAGETVEVETDKGTFTAGRLIVAADAWTNEVLAGAGVRWPLLVTKEQVTYFATPNLRAFAPDRFPVWIWHGDDFSEDFYGFPVHGEVATKAGAYTGDIVTGNARTFTPSPRSLENLTRFLERHIPGFLGPVLYTKTCLSASAPDFGFTLDFVPGHPQIVVAQGSGHAFKFAALFGRILCDLAIRGETRYPIAAFAANRPALTDPEFPPAIPLAARREETVTPEASR